MPLAPFGPEHVGHFSRFPSGSRLEIDGISTGSDGLEQFGYSQAHCLSIEDNKYDDDAHITNIELLERTLENLREGDLLQDLDGDYCKVLGVLGMVVFVSRYSRNINEGSFDKYWRACTIKEIQNDGYKLVQTEEEKVETIKIGELEYNKEEVEKRLADIKPIK